MLGRRSSPERSRLQDGNEHLSRLLQEWQGIEPRVNFEEGVWRRIRAVAASSQQPNPARAILRSWFVPRPVWVSAAATVAGVVLGVGLAFSTSAARDARPTDEPLLYARTLAGSYLTMVTGGAR